MQVLLFIPNVPKICFNRSGLHVSWNYLGPLHARQMLDQL